MLTNFLVHLVPLSILLFYIKFVLPCILFKFVKVSRSLFKCVVLEFPESNNIQLTCVIVCSFAFICRVMYSKCSIKSFNLDYVAVSIKLSSLSYLFSSQNKCSGRVVFTFSNKITQKQTMKGIKLELRLFIYFRYFGRIRDIVDFWSHDWGLDSNVDVIKNRTRCSGHVVTMTIDRHPCLCRRSYFNHL